MQYIYTGDIESQTQPDGDCYVRHTQMAPGLTTDQLDQLDQGIRKHQYSNDRPPQKSYSPDMPPSVTLYACFKQI